MIKKMIRWFIFSVMQADDLFKICKQRHEDSILERLHKNFNLPDNVIIRLPTDIGGNIKIGEGTFINSYCDIKSGPNSFVKIGNNCEIASHVCIRALTHHPERPTGPAMKLLEKDIIIGENVWIGVHSFIKEGVTIGNNVIIGANSVVTRDIPDNAVACGIPAKVIRFTGPQTKDVL